MDAADDPTDDPTLAPADAPTDARAVDEPVHPASDGRSAERADDLLPEELAAGSDDPQAQAEAILADSDERQQRRSDAAE